MIILTKIGTKTQDRVTVADGRMVECYNARWFEERNTLFILRISLRLNSKIELDGVIND